MADIANEQEQQALLHRVTKFYHHTLLNAPEAIAYLEKRRLNHPELVAAFKLGFANRTLGPVLAIFAPCGPAGASLLNGLSCGPRQPAPGRRFTVPQQAAERLAPR